MMPEKAKEIIIGELSIWKILEPNFEEYKNDFD